MGSGDWFRSIICLRKAKEDRAKKVKTKQVHSEKQNGCEGNSSTQRDQSNEREPQRSNGVGEGISLSAQHKAALRIQIAFRTYMARKSLRRRKGAVKFNVLIQGNETQKQASSTLGHIHSWSYIQAQIMARRHRMVTEDRIKQKKLENQLKLEAKLHELEMEWNGSSNTMEEILYRIQQREEAAVKRERAMAYAFSHQWRANPSQYLGQAYYSIGKENWGWSWKERWIAARPWEIRVLPQPDNKRAQGHAHRRTKSDTKLTNGKGTSSKAKKLISNSAIDHQPLKDEVNATVAGSSSPAMVPT